MLNVPYWPLGPRQIRLLSLQQNYQQQLSFEFVIADIDRGNPEYAALSYTWGDPVFPRTVTINGYTKKITQNLFDALTILAPRMRGGTKLGSSSSMPSLIWIDAICINQEDLNERSSQVRLMKTLYEHATKIYVWLGRAEDDTLANLAAAKMKEFEDRLLRTIKQARPYRPWWWPVKDQPPDDVTNTLIGISATDPNVFDLPGTPTHRAWLGIFDMLDRPWWDRTWVYQEATIPEDMTAKFIRGVAVMRPVGKISFLCGTSVVTWSQLHITMRVLEHLADMPGHHILTMYAGEYLSFHAIEHLRAARGQQFEFPLLDILRIFRTSSCKDPRDKVYAPLFLGPQSATQAIVPDYTRPVLQVYLDVARYQLQQKGHEYDFLGYVAKADKRPPLPPRRSSSTVILPAWPSWLPDWSVPISFKPLVKAIHVQRNLEGRSIKPYDTASTADHTQFTTQAYRASGDLQAAVLLEGTKLLIQSVICDSIVEAIDFDSSSHIPTVNRWRHDVRDKYWTGEPWMKALHHTYAADIKWTTDGLPGGRNGVVDRDFINRPPDHLRPQDLELQRAMTTASNQTGRRRKLCLTKNRSLGMVPDWATTNDVICMFFGSQVLHVLRARLDLAIVAGELVYEYIGEAYVHGLMDGQVLDAVRLGRMQDQMVTIV